jgi:hypothetical protein
MSATAVLGRGAAILAACLAACGAPERETPGPLLLVGIDGLEPSVVAGLLAEGRLPNLARFVEQGTVGRLATLPDNTYSPVVWTTVATGQPVADHGIDFFFEGQSQLPWTSDCRRVPALWNLVSDAGRRVDCVGWWVTWPAERIAGRMLASYAAQAQAQVIWKASYYDDIEDQTWPRELWDELREELVLASDPEAALAAVAERFPPPPLLPGDPSDVPRMVQDLAWTLSADRSNVAVAERFLSEDPGDLVMAYLAVPDVVGHRFWRYHEPQAYSYPIDAEALAALGDWVERAHEDADASLGRLLDRIGPEWTVVVLSDHGMRADPATLDDPAAINSGHHRDGTPGLVAALGPGVERGGNRLAEPALGSVFDVAPFVLRRLGLPLPEHWPSVRGTNGLERALTSASWDAAHPARRSAPPDREWIARNPRRAVPTAPSNSTSEDFMRAFEALGYFERGAARPVDGTGTPGER